MREVEDGGADDRRRFALLVHRPQPARLSGPLHGPGNPKAGGAL